MLEQTSTLAYKSIAHIVREPQKFDGPSLFESILTYVASYLKNRFSLTIDERFISGSPFKSSTDGCMLQTVILRPDEGKQDKLRWAVYVRVKDNFNRRRTWIDHIGLKQHNNDSFTLYFAEYYITHQAGSLISFKPPRISPPALLKELIHSPAFSCMNGSYRLTDVPWIIIAEELDEFISLMYDRKRTLPIVVVTCPDMVSLSTLCSKTTCNLIVCCLDDFGTYANLCSKLPPSLQFQWDTIKIFMPFSSEKAYHTMLQFPDIADMGSEGVCDALYRAFCTCLTADERRAFINVDTIYDILRARDLDKLREQNESLRLECKKLKKDNGMLETDKQQLSSALDAVMIKLQRSESTDYEDLLDESYQESAKLKHGINMLISQIYNDPRGLISIAAEDECQEIIDMAAALRTLQSISGLQH